MGYIQGSDRNQIVLFPDCLDNYVDKDNEVRIIDAFVDALDIGKHGFKAEPATEGRPGYDPRDMLKLYIYGYLNHKLCRLPAQTHFGKHPRTADFQRICVRAEH